MVAPFTIIHRTYPNGKKAWMARYLDSAGKVIRSVTLHGVKNAREATREADRLLRDGIVSRQDDPYIMDFLRDFWKPDSDYVRERARAGVHLSEAYIAQSGDVAARRFGTIFKDRRMSDLSKGLVERALSQIQDDIFAKHRAHAEAELGRPFEPAELEAFKKRERESLAGNRTLKIAAQTLTVPTRWYCALHDIKYPLGNLGRIKVKYQEKGALTAAEVAQVMKVTDEAPRIRAVMLLGCLCGLRLGEVRGLKWTSVDLEKGLIEVKDNAVAGSATVKKPKWDSVRIVPAPAALIEVLRLIQTMPDARGDFVVYNQTNPERPVETVTIGRAFKRILRKAGIDDTAQKDRHLSFHSMRHTYISLARAAGISDLAVSRIAGHRSLAMTDHYSHANVLDFAKAAETLTNTIMEAENEIKSVGGKV